MTEKQRLDVFEQVWKLVNEHFHDADFNGVDWQKMRREYEPGIAACTNTDSLSLLLNDMLFELNSSHCGVGPLSEIERVISPYLFAAGDIGIDVRILDGRIVVTTVSASSPADRAGVKPGFTINSIDGLALSEIEARVRFRPPFNERNRKFHLTSEVLRGLYGEPNTTVTLAFTDEAEQSHSRTLMRTERKQAVLLGAGLPPAFPRSSAMRLTGKIACLRFNAFRPSDMEHVLDDVAKVADSEGLVIDLRGNDGGSVEGMKLLLGRFVSRPMKYGAYVNRHERDEDSIAPAGDRYRGKVVLLVDEMSISAAENMAGIFQQLGIGKVIGQRTPGQMLWGEGYVLHDSIALAIPVYRLEYLNGRNPENNGISPDVEVRLKKEELLRGKDTQLEKAVEVLKSEIRKQEAY